jgi:hypothetical protein
MNFKKDEIIFEIYSCLKLEVILFDSLFRIIIKKIYIILILVLFPSLIGMKRNIIKKQNVS